MKPEGGVLGGGRSSLQPGRRAGHQLLEIVLPGLGCPAADQDHMPEEWKLAPTLPERRPECRRRDDGTRPAVGQEKALLVWRDGEADRGRYRANLDRTEERADEFGSVGQQDRNTLLDLDPQSRKGIAHLVHPLLQVGKRHAPGLEDVRDPVSVPSRDGPVDVLPRGVQRIRHVDLGRRLAHSSGPQRRRPARARCEDLAACRGALAPREAELVARTAIASISTRSSGFTSRETMRSVLGGYAPPGKRRGNTSRRACMNPSMSEACVRNVWNRTTSAMLEPAAARTARTFSNACFVWAATSPDPTTLPARSVPTCPATMTSSPAGTVMPCEYLPSAGPRSLEVTGFGATGRLPEPDVLEVNGPAVDAARRRRNPVRELPRVGHRLHQALHVHLVLLGG